MSNPAVEKTVTPLLSNRVYDILKKATLVWLPALSALYFALSGIWGLPNAEQVVGTIAAVCTFLGVTLHLSTSSYNKSDSKYDGALVVNSTTERDIYSFELNGHPEDLKEKDSQIADDLELLRRALEA